ncbi:acylhydrolase [Pedobacter sp. HMWF019]|uniref:SGNH/GDSL hydrolase family protein n=1 Tax=Pedobacter sp. HMWF019 TaxID=2056856 RepID=UPI000D36806B|nr:SGNH/GDSL hydrolase family protein [Pedobacter sp. HMWF019]PTS94358.1 acylhydrolase [Pedobacter sp. HMWF019]
MNKKTIKHVKIVSTLLLLGIFGNRASAQDWPALKFYQEANQRADQEHPKEKRVVFMGNSITQIWGDIDPGFFEQHKNFINRGISGQTTPQMVLRFRQDVINLKPAVVVILGGTNDIAGNTGPATLDEIFGNLVSMMELAKANHIHVVISSILPVFDYPWKKGLEPAGKIIELNERLKKYAAQQHNVYLDYHSVMKDERNGLKSSLTRDGVHPTLAGYKIMEPLLEKAISQALNQKYK